MKPKCWMLLATLALSAALTACSPGTLTPTSTAVPRATLPASTPTLLPATPAPATPVPTVVPTSTPEPRTALVASYSELTPINLPLWIADEQGYFTRHGLSVDARYVESSLGVSALLSGEEQFAAMGGSESLAAAIGGADLQVLACFSPVYPYKLEVASDINSADDLKGRKIGVSRFGSSSDSATRAALRQIGLDPDKDVTLVQVGSLSARTAALLGGNLDAAVSPLPDNLILEDHGFHALVDLAADKLPAVNNVLVARKSWISAHKELTQAYVDGIVEGVAKAKADKPYALQLIQKYLKDRAGDTTQMSAAYDFDIQEVMQMPPVTRPHQFRDALDQIVSQDPRASDFDVSTIINNSFVEDAVARGLGKTN
jgi:NitT/TauT family transport system substrate-binding protein